MHEQLVKISKSNTNETSMSDLLSSPFSSGWWGKYASLIMDKRELESKLFKASSAQISSLQETVSLLSMWIGEENEDYLSKSLSVLV